MSRIDRTHSFVDGLNEWDVVGPLYTVFVKNDSLGRGNEQRSSLQASQMKITNKSLRKNL